MSASAIVKKEGKQEKMKMSRELRKILYEMSEAIFDRLNSITNEREFEELKDLVIEFTKKGGDLDAFEKYGYKPILYVLSKYSFHNKYNGIDTPYYPKVVQLLLENGSNPNLYHRQSKKSSIYYLLIGFSNFNISSMLQMFAEYGFNFYSNFPPTLKFALYLEKPHNIIKILINNGAAVNYKNLIKRNVLNMYERMYEFSPINELILNRAQAENAYRHKYGDETFRLLLDTGADLTLTNNRTGNTPLHEVAMSGDINLCKLFMEYCDFI